MDAVGVVTPLVRGGAQVLHGDQVVEHTNSEEKWTFSSRPPDVQSAWTGRTVKILSAFADEAQAQCIYEGGQTLTWSPDISNHSYTATARRWNPHVQRLLFNISQGILDMV